MPVETALNRPWRIVARRDVLLRLKQHQPPTALSEIGSRALSYPQMAMMPNAQSGKDRRSV